MIKQKFVGSGFKPSLGSRAPKFLAFLLLTSSFSLAPQKLKAQPEPQTSSSVQIPLAQLLKYGSLLFKLGHNNSTEYFLVTNQGESGFKIEINNATIISINASSIVWVSENSVYRAKQMPNGGVAIEEQNFGEGSTLIPWLSGSIGALKNDPNGGWYINKLESTGQYSSRGQYQLPVPPTWNLDLLAQSFSEDGLTISFIASELNNSRLVILRVPLSKGNPQPEIYQFERERLITEGGSFVYVQENGERLALGQPPGNTLMYLNPSSPTLPYYAENGQQLGEFVFTGSGKAPVKEETNYYPFSVAPKSAPDGSWEVSVLTFNVQGNQAVNLQSQTSQSPTNNPPVNVPFNQGALSNNVVPTPNQNQSTVTTSAQNNPRPTSGLQACWQIINKARFFISRIRLKFTPLNDTEGLLEEFLRVDSKFKSPKEFLEALHNKGFRNITTSISDVENHAESTYLELRLVTVDGTVWVITIHKTENDTWQVGGWGKEDQKNN